MQLHLSLAQGSSVFLKLCPEDFDYRSWLPKKLSD